jgi:hypothetical protein
VGTDLDNDLSLGCLPLIHQLPIHSPNDALSALSFSVCIVASGSLDVIDEASPAPEKYEVIDLASEGPEPVGVKSFSLWLACKLVTKEGD